MTARARSSTGQPHPPATSDSEPIIRARGLTKRFKRAVKGNGLKGPLRHLVRPEYTDVTAVDDISLEIMPGESVAYVGPNGAGKSTTVKFAKFPLEIYNVVIQILVTVVAPFAFISYFPGLVLLDKDTGWRWLGYASPLAAAIMVVLTAWLWHKALACYQGVGH